MKMRILIVGLDISDERKILNYFLVLDMQKIIRK